MQSFLDLSFRLRRRAWRFVFLYCIVFHLALSHSPAAATVTKEPVTHPSALQLWRELQPLVATGNLASAREIIKRDAEGGSALYRELLFEAATSSLYENPPLPYAEEVRRLLTENNAENAALEAKLSAWIKDRKFEAGFTKDGRGVEQLIYLSAISKLRGEDKKTSDDAPKGTARELSERAASLAASLNMDLAAATFTANIAVYSLREKRLREVPALVAESENVWRAWGHSIGLSQVPLIIGYSYFIAENWREAAPQLERAAELAKALPGLRSQRVNALSLLATSLRNLGEKERARLALQAAIEEQTQVVEGKIAAPEAQLKEAKTLADLEIQLGGACAALNRHTEAGEWYARGDQLKEKNYRQEKSQLETQVAQLNAKLETNIAASKTEQDKKIWRQARETFSDTILSYLDGLALERDDLSERLHIAEQRLALAREGGTPENIAKGLEEVANAERKAGNLAEARATALEALRIRSNDALRRRIYDTVYLLGEIAYAADDWQEATARYREVMELTKPAVLPPPFDLNAAPNEDIRRVQKRMNEFERALRASKSLDAQAAIGFMQALQGNYRAAETEYNAVERSLPQLYAIGAPDEDELSRWLSTQTEVEVKSLDVAAHRRQTGVIIDKDERSRIELVELAVKTTRALLMHYRAMLFEAQNDLTRAAETYTRGINSSANLVGGGFALTGVYVALARIERERGDYVAAESPVAAALAEAERKHDASGIANMLAFQSILRRDQKRLSESRQLAEAALKIARPLKSRSQIAGLLRTLGRTESEIGEAASLKSSEQHLRESLALWRALGLRAEVAYTLSNLGQTLERLNRDDEALAAYSEAVSIVETLVGSLASNATAETFNASRGNRELYENLIKLLIKRGRTADAFSYLERSKSKALVDALNGTHIKSQNEQTSALLERVRATGDALRVSEKALTIELAKPNEQRNDKRIAAAQDKLNDARRGYENALAELKRAQPDYAHLVAVNPSRLDEMRDKLPPKTLLLSYFPSDRDLYIFVVTHGQTTIRRAPVARTALAELVAQYRRALSPKVSGLPPSESRGMGLAAEMETRGASDSQGKTTPPLKDTTAKLYDALLAPAQMEIDQADTILIVPAGELYYLPIHALGRVQTNGTVSYLIGQKRFAYLASADALKTFATNAPKSDVADISQMIALGNPDGSLPGATEEVQTLGKMFSNAKVFTGNTATIARVTQASSAHTPFIHFATHGIINHQDPKESFLLLAGEPNRLTIKDIIENNYHISFDGARLVTLSACDTSIGGWDPSATYSSLSRAFAKAGAPTVIASLWSVSDRATRDLMTVFYRELAAGQSKAEAMRRAQVAVMHNQRFSHPYYWAPFIVIGEWR